MNNLPPGWAEVSLGDVAETRLGRMLSGRRETGTHARPYLRNRDVQWGYINVDSLPRMDFPPADVVRFNLHAGDVLVCEGGEVGRAAIWNGQLDECYYQKALHRIRTTPALSPRFLRYLFEHYAYANLFQRHTSGSTIAHLPQEDLRNLHLPLPPPAEQERIVAAIEEQFSRLDAGVAALQRVRQNLKRMRAAVLATLINDQKGKAWPLVELGEVLLRGRYGTSTKCTYEGSGTPVLRIPNIQSQTVSLYDLKFAVDEDLDLTSALVEEDDVLIIRTNGSRSLIGRAAVVPSLSQSIAFASYLIQLRINHDVLNPRYLVASLASPQMRREIEQLAATTAGQYNISLYKLRSLRVPVPSSADQLDLLAAADRQLSVVDALASEINHIEGLSVGLRSSILAAAFSGELVSQDATDEPASLLLDRIAAERASFNGHRRSRNGNRRARGTA